MSRLSDLDALLTSLGDTLTVEEMEYAIRDYQDREVRTVLANRAAAGGGGGAASVRLVGPVRVNHDDAGFDGNPGVLVTTLVGGEVVMNIGVRVIVAAPAGVYLKFAIGPSDWATGNFWNVVSSAVDSTSSGDAEAGAFAKTEVELHVNDPDPITGFLVPGGYMLDAEGGALICYVSGGAENRATGQFDVYVVVGTPA